MKLEAYSLRDVKSYLKDLAKVIRISKLMRKTVHRPDFSKMDQRLVKWAELSYLDRFRSDFRHIHIAYCESRGKTREQIENKAETSPDEERVAVLKALIQETMRKEREEHVGKETVCSDS